MIWNQNTGPPQCLGHFPSFFLPKHLREFEIQKESPTRIILASRKKKEGAKHKGENDEWGSGVV